jgi:hypothetical protein
MKRAGQVLIDAFNIIVRNPVVGGFPRLRQLSRAARQAVVAGLVLSSATAILIGLGDQLRSLSSLQRDTSAEVALYIPSVALVIVPYLVSCALGVILIGAVRADRRVFATVLAVYSLIQLALVRLTLDTGAGVAGPVVVLSLVAVVVVTSAVARRVPFPTELLAVVLLAASSLSMLVVVRTLNDVSTKTGESFDIVVLQVVLQALALLCLPMVFMAGLDASKFSIVTANWLSEQVARVRGRSTVGLVALLVFLLSVVQGAGRLRDWWLDSSWRGLAPVGVCVLCAAAVRRVIKNRTGEQSDDAAVRSSQSLAFRVSAFVVVVPLLIQVLGLFQIILGVSAPASIRVIQPIVDTLLIDELALTARLLVGAGLLYFVWRRPTAPLSRVVMLVAGLVLVIDNTARLTGPGALVVTAQHVDVVIIGGVLMFAVRSTLARRLQSGQLASLAGLLALSGVASHNSFAAGPLASLLPLGGLSLLLFGLLWGVFTGAGDANESSPSFPSESRLLLFAGYQLLTISMVLWAVLTRDTTLTDQLASSTDLGVRTVGIGLLVAIVAGHARESAHRKEAM